jgi:hypothetical protein
MVRKITTTIMMVNNSSWKNSSFSVGSSIFPQRKLSSHVSTLQGLLATVASSITRSIDCSKTWIQPLQSLKHSRNSCSTSFKRSIRCLLVCDDVTEWGTPR